MRLEVTTPLANALYRALDRRRALGSLPRDQRAAVFRELSAGFPDLSWLTFIEALGVIENLRRAVYDLADRARDTGRPPAAVARDLAARFPGFDHDVIDRAVSDGFFASR